MIDLRSGGITNILSSYLKKKTEVQSLEFALNSVVKRILENSSRIRLYSGVDNLDSRTLDLLASELKTQFYDTEFSVEVKRALVKNTIKWYMRVGTSKVVEELVIAVFGEGKLLEWQDYGGKPFRFKVITNTTISGTNIEKFREMIKNVKNARSILEVVESVRTIETMESYGTYTYAYYKVPDIR